MIKIKKKNNPKINQLFAIELADKKHWTISHLCYLVEVQGYYSLTFGFFNILENSFSTLTSKFDEYDLTNPIMIATIDINPLKEWNLLGEKKIIYENVDVASRITGSWGWFDKTERDLFAILESYFGIYPWDLLRGPSSLESILLTKTKSADHRYLRDYTMEEIKELGLFGKVEYAGRLEELKK